MKLERSCQNADEILDYVETYWPERRKCGYFPAKFRVEWKNDKRFIYSDLQKVSAMLQKFPWVYLSIKVFYTYSIEEH